MSTNIEESQFEGLSQEERYKLGLVVPPPRQKSLGEIAKAVGLSEQELRILGTARTAAQYEEATKRIAALRELRQERERQALVDELEGTS